MRVFTARRAALLICVAVAATGLGIAALRAGGESSHVPPGTVVVGIADFVGAPAVDGPGSFLASEVVKTNPTGLVVRTAGSRPATQQAAEAERVRLKADFLIWGEMAASGDMTVSVEIAPTFQPVRYAWERWSDQEPTALVLPRHNQMQIGASGGIYPLVPLVLALSNLGTGNYPASAQAAAGAQATIEQAGGDGQFASMVAATALGAGGDYKGAAQIYSALDRDGMAAPEALVNRGYTRLQMSDYPGARSDLDRVISGREASNIVLARAHMLRGRALYRLAGDTTSALGEIEESLRLDPDYLPAMLDRAQVLYRQSVPDAARLQLDSLLRKAPDAAPADRLMGLVWLMLGKPQDALRSLEQAGKIYTGWISDLRAEEGKAQVTGDQVTAKRATDGIVLLNRELGKVYLYQGMALADGARQQPPEGLIAGLWRRIRGEPTAYDLSIKALQEAAKLDPRNADVSLQMGSVYAAMGDADKAAGAIQQAQALDPAAPQPYLSLARLYQERGLTAEAVKTLNELLDHAPGAYLAYSQLHDLYVKANEANSASAVLNRALAVAPLTPADHLWHGKFLHILGKDAEASAELQTAGADPSLWEAHLLLGQLLLDGGHVQDALAHFQQVLAVQPNEPTALLNSGRLLALAGQPGDAEKLYVRLTTTSPSNVDGHMAYVDLLIGKGDLGRATAEGERAVQADNNRADAYFALGRAYEAQKNWPAAVEQYSSSTKRDPKSFDAFIRLGIALYHDDRYADSKAASEEAIKLRPDDPQAYRWKAEAQFALREPGEALSTLGQSLRIAPGLADALALTARAYALKGDPTSGIAYARMANRADGLNPAGALALGEVLLSAGRNAEAIEAFGSVANTVPAEATTGQGRAYAAMGDRDKALGLYRSAMEADKQYADAHLYAGHTYVEMGRWDDALREYATAVQKRPHWPEALYYTGRAYLQRKDLPGAQRYFESATTYGPNIVEAWFGLGIARRDRGQQKEAIAALQRATQLNKDYADAWLYLGLTYEETGERGLAAQAFQNAQRSASDPSIKQQAEQGLARLR